MTSASWRFQTGLLVAIGLAAAACETMGGAGAGGRSGAGVAVGEAAPEVAVTDLKGKSVSLASLRGQVVLLDVWASWCEPCKAELPLLDEIAGRLKGSGVRILAVSVDQDRANVDAFLAARPRWTLTVAHDPDGEVVATRYQPPKMPSSYVIDQQGIVRHVNAGFEPADAKKIEAQLSALAK